MFYDLFLRALVQRYSFLHEEEPLTGRLQQQQAMNNHSGKHSCCSTVRQMSVLFIMFKDKQAPSSTCQSIYHSQNYLSISRDGTSLFLDKDNFSDSSLGEHVQI